jgi:hypothetical protein
VLAYDSQNRTRLVVHYNLFSPAEATVEYRLNDGRGSLSLGTARRRLADGGVIRLTKRLGDAVMERVRTARLFTVSIDISAAPRYCRRYETRRLTVRRAVRHRVVWLQAYSVFGPGQN